mmetsp:Transcript_48831/g.105988  ORF Transcript_48831/g.105988 Transcript_48831/m.105988 type:complete len:230 (+) Transcript_48831:104-793(+)
MTLAPRTPTIASGEQVQRMKCERDRHQTTSPLWSAPPLFSSSRHLNLATHRTGRGDGRRRGGGRRDLTYTTRSHEGSIGAGHQRRGHHWTVCGLGTQAKRVKRTVRQCPVSPRCRAEQVPNRWGCLQSCPCHTSRRWFGPWCNRSWVRCTSGRGSWRWGEPLHGGRRWRLHPHRGPVQVRGRQQQSQCARPRQSPPSSPPGSVWQSSECVLRLGRWGVVRRTVWRREKE